MYASFSLAEDVKRAPQNFTLAFLGCANRDFQAESDPRRLCVGYKQLSYVSGEERCTSVCLLHKDLFMTLLPFC